MRFEKFEENILDAALQSFSIYLSACEQIKNDGLTTISKNGYLRKHPCCEIAKTNWSNFLQGLKQLKIQDAYEDILKFDNNIVPKKRGPKMKN